jgi:flagellar protein FliO/FliZ
MIATTLRVVLSLGTVLGLMWVVARFMPGRVRVRSNNLLTVVARQPLGRNASLSVVTVGDRVLVLGVTDQKVTLVSELDADELPLAQPVATDVVPALVEKAEPAESLLAASAELEVAAPTPIAGRRRRVVDTESAPIESVSSVAETGPAKQATEAAEQHAFAAVLQGSILSPQTWKQAAAATRGSSGAHRGRRAAS